MSDLETSPLQQALAIEDRLKRALFVVGVIARDLDRYAKPIVVGGTAVEFYTLGAYTTQDVDLVCPSRSKAIKALERLGFERTENLRHWYHGELEMVVEIPDESLAGDVRRLADVVVNGLTVHLIGIEDLILDRLRECVHWRSESDCEWARRLMAIHLREIDWDYLSQSAEQDGLKERLNALDPRKEHK